MTNHNHSNFWFGFLLGAGTTCSALYFFGTKKGREQLKTALDATENIEDTVSDVLEALDPQQHTNNIPPDTMNQSILSKIFEIIQIIFGQKKKKTQPILESGVIS